MSERAERLIAELAALGVRLWEEQGRLRFRAPGGVMTEERKNEIRTRREEILAALRGPAVVPHPDERHVPFPVTDTQAAYLLGRRDSFAYGGVGCHGYGELHFADLDVDRLTAVWNRIIARHDMLRAVVSADGAQQVLPAVPEYVVEVRDGADAVAANRAELDHRVYDPGRWSLFTLRVSRGTGPRESVVHLSIDFLVCDFVSIQILLDELYHGYHQMDAEPEPLDITFRDYLMAERRLRSGPEYERDRDYWLGRVDDMPPAPELPLAPDAERAPPRFHRHALTVPPERWAALCARAAAEGLTPSSLVLAAFAEVIGMWSAKPRFTLDVTLLTRRPLHPQVDRLVGDFTSVSLLSVDRGATTFAERAAAAQRTLWEDLDHSLFSGVEVMRELARRRGAASALMPVVFTSAIGLDSGDSPTGLGYGISQTPQVWIDCQNFIRDGSLMSNWDVRTGVFPPGMVEEMFAAYEALLRDLAEPRAWTRRAPVPLPGRQHRTRATVNDTAALVPSGLLHEGILDQVARTPDAPLVLDAEETLSYREVTERAAGVADALRAHGCAPRDLVAVVADKGWRQVVAVLGTLMAGAAYVPIDTNQPTARQQAIIESAEIALVLTESARVDTRWPAGCRVIGVDDRRGRVAYETPDVGPDALAYVIYTSGSTGEPKGVMISHRAALNTVRDIDARFGVGPGDRVLGLASLGFDLSVYDIFGPPGRGGTLVFPSPERRGDPGHWADLVAEHGVTLWNSVPAQLQMLADYLDAAPDVRLPSLRLALLSGDWVPVTLPDQIRVRLPALELASLGGATEAAIWSICHPIDKVDPTWTSIPYGTPLANQTFHVLDHAMEPRPDWVTGDLHIGGAGLAEGYLNDPDKTSASFVTHPETGERLYRTGDLGRYRPDGVIEFLGREDFQVKIRGHRIELGEIEVALRSHHGVAGCAVVANGDRPLDRTLAAFVQTAARAAEPPPEPGATATEAGRTVIGTTDVSAYLTYLRELDEAALAVMLGAFRASGLFDGAGREHTLEEIYAKAGVAPRHRRLIRRFLRALTTEGVLTDGYRLVREPPVPDWDRLAALAGAAGQDDDLLLGYFRDNASFLPELLRDEEDAARLLFPEGSFAVSDRLYQGTLFNRWAGRIAASVVRDLVDGRQPLRVLEVGAGAGGTTAEMLQVLDGQVLDGQVLDGLVLDYLCTDLSPFFVQEAQRRFGYRGDMRFSLFDLDADPGAQGLPPNSMDVVVAGDVLHATRDIPATLARLRELLTPGGWLVLVEMTRDHYQIMAALEPMIRLDEAVGDFLDLRSGTDRTFLDAEEWHRVLREAGGEPVACPIGTDDGLAEVGIRVMAARFKASRVPLDAGELRDHLASLLPDHMIPAEIRVVDALPYTGNGKLDRGALRGWLSQTARAAAAGGEEPHTDLERRLAAYWADALGRDQVARDEDFFALGGDSLLAARLAGRIVEKLPEAAGHYFDALLRRLLEVPTVAAMADHLDGGETEQRPDEPEAGEPEEPAESVLVPLGGQGEWRYLLAHDASGSLMGHPGLLRALRRRGEVWGVSGEALARDPAATIAGSLDAAVPYVPRDGPWRVVGYGSGGPVALALASRLVEAGAEVGEVVVAEPDAVEEAPVPYLGDVDLLVTGDEPPAWWAEACLGELRVHRLPDDGAAAIGPALDERVGR